MLSIKKNMYYGFMHIWYVKIRLQIGAIELKVKQNVTFSGRYFGKTITTKI